MYSRVKNFFKDAIKKDTSPTKLAVAISFAAYVAFSPFLGFHTIMLIAFGWLFNINIPFLVGVGYAINNPWTMVPIYMSGYLFGYWLLHVFMAVPVEGLNPAWMAWFSHKIMDILHIKEPSFWAFMVGGNIVGLVFAFMTYPAALVFFKKMAREN